MKLKRLVPALILSLTLFACKKEVLTREVHFTATTYQTLGTFDSSGKPSYLLPKDPVSSNLMTYINNTLPERSDLRTSHPDLLTTKAIADLAITQTSDVFLTFISDGTGNSNAIGFYTYPSNTPPKSPDDITTITYAFPNAGYGTPLEPGDKVKLGRFNAGTSIGFAILQNAWNLTTKKLNNDAVHFCSNDILNPEVDPNLKKHAVLINFPSENKVIIGFEDINRTDGRCDHDFNDVMFYATITP